MKKTLLCVLTLLVTQLNAQIFDNFDDGDFTNNPQWTGTPECFIVNTSNQLQLNDEGANQAFLITNSTRIHDTEWRFWIKFSFSPSSNNNIRYYLVSSNNNLLNPTSGYFLQFGESGSNDAIELFRQTETEIISICRGTDGSISSSSELRIKVTRDNSGYWKVFSDLTGGEEFTLQAEGNDNTYVQSSTTGIFCKYTSSNSKKVYFDDLYIGPIIVDTIPPEILGCIAQNDSVVSLKFNEFLDAGSVVNTNNYLVDNNMGNPVFAICEENDGSEIVLTFNNKLESGKQYSMQVSGVTDISGNTMIPGQIAFNYYYPKQYDVMINEIMADPTPPVNLPEYEYIELYNRTNSNIDLSGWTLLIGSSVKEFNDIEIESESYLILAKESAYDLFANYGDFYGFSGLSLTNSGQNLTLISDNEEIISQVSYEDSWYENSLKEDGGWSLELINSNNICSGSENWLASINIDGGTPGRKNSVWNDIVFRPQIVKLEIVNDNTLHIYYSQSMDYESVSDKTSYTVDNIGNPDTVNVISDSYKKAELIFPDPFIRGLIYQLNISSEILSCSMLGLLNDTTVLFGKPDSASYIDIVINEILFNPLENGEDYVELYNRSNKIIDISSLKIGSVKHSPPNNPDTALCKIVVDQQLMMPGDYIVVSESKSSVLDQYYTTNPNAFVDVYSMPSFNNDQGNVLLLSGEKTIIDSFSYSEDMHFPLLLYFDGVALEKIDPNSISSNGNSWHSASENVGFGTPGYANSQSINYTDSEDEIVISPEIFSPDNDGVDDILSIEYRFDTPGYVMSVTIYN